MAAEPQDPDVSVLDVVGLVAGIAVDDVAEILLTHGDRPLDELGERLRQRQENRVDLIRRQLPNRAVQVLCEAEVEDLFGRWIRRFGDAPELRHEHLPRLAEEVRGLRNSYVADRVEAVSVLLVRRDP
ncbi:MAG TPA: hypothetical protein VGL20_19895 [Candidatus Dormibacteraeota bacterium]|jgi:hypothetical protein